MSFLRRVSQSLRCFCGIHRRPWELWNTPGCGWASPRHPPPQFPLAPSPQPQQFSSCPGWPVALTVPSKSQPFQHKEKLQKSHVPPPVWGVACSFSRPFTPQSQTAFEREAGGQWGWGGAVEVEVGIILQLGLRAAPRFPPPLHCTEKCGPYLSLHWVLPFPHPSPVPSGVPTPSYLICLLPNQQLCNNWRRRRYPVLRTLYHHLPENCQNNHINLQWLCGWHPLELCRAQLFHCTLYSALWVIKSNDYMQISCLLVIPNP